MLKCVTEQASITAADRSGMQRLTSPKSIALIGASSDPGKLSGRPVFYLKTLGFSGPVYPVNPKLEQIHGIRCWSDISEIPNGVDVAVISRPAKNVLADVRKCLKQGIRAFVVLSGGFAESGAEGMALQTELSEICRRAGAVLCGPNSVGIVNVALHAAMTTASNIDNEIIDNEIEKRGSIALVSNSGSLAAITFLGLGHVLRFLVAVGNEAVLTGVDFIAHLLEDPQVSGVVAILETIRDPIGLESVAARAHELGKPVAILKGGRNREAAKIAESHTGALIDDDVVIDAVFDSLNIIRVKDIAELKAMAILMHGANVRKVGRRVGVLTPSGGAAVLMTDELIEEGLELPAPSVETINRVRSIIPDVAPNNPMDVTGFGNDPVRFGMAACAMTADQNFSMLMIPMGGAVGTIAEGRADGLIKAALENDKLIVPIWQSSTSGQRGFEKLRRSGLPLLTDYAMACRVVAALVRHNERVPLLVSETSNAGAVLSPEAGKLIGRTIEEYKGPSTLAEPLVKDILRAQQICVPYAIRLRGPDDNLLPGANIRFPAILKVVSPDILHKSIVGGVATVFDSGALAGSLQNMSETVATNRPDARIEGFLLEELLLGGVELFVGVKGDERFGPIISLGVGGILANDCGRPAIARLPLFPEQAERLLRSFSPTLARDKTADAIIHFLISISALAMGWGPRLKTLEINPVKIMRLESKCTAWALDGVVELR